jgi:hypothetical protein
MAEGSRLWKAVARGNGDVSLQGHYRQQRADIVVHALGQKQGLGAVMTGNAGLPDPTNSHATPESSWTAFSHGLLEFRMMAYVQHIVPPGCIAPIRKRWSEWER